MNPWYSMLYTESVSQWECLFLFSLTYSLQIKKIYGSWKENREKRNFDLPKELTTILLPKNFQNGCQILPYRRLLSVQRLWLWKSKSWKIDFTFKQQNRYYFWLWHLWQKILYFNWFEISYFKKTWSSQRRKISMWLVWFSICDKICPKKTPKIQT